MGNELRHSKLPWKVDDDWREDGADQIIDDNCLTICFMATPIERHADDAKFIVDVCNNYESLQERVIGLESRLDIYYGNMYDVVCAENEKLCKKLEIAVEAIKQAKQLMNYDIDHEESGNGYQPRKFIIILFLLNTWIRSFIFGTAMANQDQLVCFHLYLPIWMNLEDYLLQGL